MRSPGLRTRFKRNSQRAKFGIDGDVLPAHLHEKRGVSDEGDAQLAIADQLWFVGTAGAGSDRGVADQPSELLCPLAQSRISQESL